MCLLLHKRDLPVAIAQRSDLAVVSPVDELLARPRSLPAQRGAEVITVKMDLVGAIADLGALLQRLLDVLATGSVDQRQQQVLVRGDVVDHGAGLDDAGPADHRRHAVATFPVGVLLAAEHRGAAVGPGKGLGAVVGRVHDDGVLVEAELLQLRQHLPHVPIVLDHAIGVDAQAGLARRLLLQMREDMHPGRVPPQEERLVRLLRAVHEVQCLGRDLLVDRLHALARQRTGIGDLAVGKAVDDAARPELLLELRVLRVIGVLGLLLGVQVIQIAEKFVEAMRGGQHVIAVAEVVLAELAGHVALRPQQRGDGGVFLLHPLRRARQADLGQAGADRRLTRDESRAPCGAALLSVPVGEQRPLAGNAVDVGRPVAHHSHVVRTDVELADVIAPDDDDVRLARGRLRLRLCWGGNRQHAGGDETGQDLQEQLLARVRRATPDADVRGSKATGSAPGRPLHQGVMQRQHVMRGAAAGAHARSHRSGAAHRWACAGTRRRQAPVHGGRDRRRHAR